MKRLNSLLSAFALCAILFTVGCKKKNDPKPASELIIRNWGTKEVKEGGVKVYEAPFDAANDTRDYSRFKLEFLNATDVRLTELDGAVFNGKWALSNNNTTLTLSNLNPQPTGTSGIIQYTNVSVTETQLTITRSGTNPKTGISTTEYVMQ